MYADWRASGEGPLPEPPRRPPPPSRTPDRWAWLVIAIPLVMLLAPFAGGSLVQAVLAALR